MRESRSLKVDVFVSRIDFIESDQALYFSKERETFKSLVSNIQPNNVFVSSNLASAINFVIEAKSNRFRGSFSLKGRPIRCMANSTAASPLSTLLLMSTITDVMSSIYTSDFPLSLSLKVTAKGSACSKGVGSSSIFALGTLCCIGEDSSFGSQSSRRNKAFARSVVDSETLP